MLLENLSVQYTNTLDVLTTKEIPSDLMLTSMDFTSNLCCYSEFRRRDVEQWYLYDNVSTMRMSYKSYVT